MGQLYTYSDSKTKPFLVLKDIHSHFPKADSPPLAPLYTILDENPELDVEEFTTKVMKICITTATEIANDKKLV
jgi:hypothetical protein